MKIAYPTSIEKPVQGPKQKLWEGVKDFFQYHFRDALVRGILGVLVLALLSTIIYGISQLVISMGLTPALKLAGIIVLCAFGALGFTLGLGEFMRRKDWL